MSEIRFSGPAFPTQHPALDPRACGFQTEPGMTLRDYFAAKAMEALIVALIDPKAIQSVDGTRMAETAYAFADEMLKERSK
jgi:hypothetical protein